MKGFVTCKMSRINSMLVNGEAKIKCLERRVADLEKRIAHRKQVMQKLGAAKSSLQPRVACEIPVKQPEWKPPKNTIPFNF